MDQTLEPITQFLFNIFPQPFFLTILTFFADLATSFFSFLGLNIGVVPI